MEARERRVNVETYARSGPAAVALQKELKYRDEAGLADPSPEECIAICEEADFRAVYGHDAKRDKNGGVQQGLGSPGHETGNHFAAIRRYEGKEAWEKAVRDMWKRDPKRAKAINLPELPRVGS